ncbi:MAG: peptide deformylase [Bacteroidetes bacterium GWF2_49_14]|nr:MAG: peptide deformylase [Bacteroidetes bacterium GWF2_49_14]HBB93006.1 peptide deformylase [Bacteroidales bacterium]
MILPVYAYGSPVLKKVAEVITAEYAGLSQLISDMFETMWAADGVGLAAPQIGLAIRLFVMDARVYSEEDPALKDFKKVFINAHILERTGEEELIQEGCLSIPNIHEDILRPGRIRIQYLDEDFAEHDEWYEGMVARIIQHEYDHLDGILFPELLSPLKKRLLKGKLRDISTGKITVKYRMVFPLKK